MPSITLTGSKEQMTTQLQEALDSIQSGSEYSFDAQGQQDQQFDLRFQPDDQQDGVRATWREDSTTS